MSDELHHAMTAKIKRRGRCSNKRDKRLEESHHHKKGDIWSEAKKLECATYFLVLGNAKKVEEFTGVPAGTIHSWKKTEWWQDLIQEAKDAHNEELDAKMTGILDKALDNVKEGLENGDTRYDPKRGETYRIPVDTRNTAIVAAALYDKRAMLRGDPTSRTESISSDKRLKKLEQKFREMSNMKVIEGEVIKDNASEDGETA